MKRINIILLEDNSSDAELTIRALKKAFPECTVNHLTSIQGARKTLSTLSDFDIALLDMQLPDGNGMDIVMEIRHKQLDMAVVMLTGSGDEEVAVAALKAGADDYIVKKPGYTDKVPRLVELALENHRQYSERSSGMIHVLYVEHNAADVDFTRRHLTRFAPYIRLTDVPDGKKALELLPDAGTPPSEWQYQLLVMDYRLPGMNALEVIKEIRLERKLDIPILIVTGHGNEEVAVQALKVGANEYLVKQGNYLTRLPSLISGAYEHIELKRKQKALKESEAQYRLLAENADDVIFTLDFNLKFTYVSPAVYPMHGFEPQELINKGISEILTPESLTKIQKIVERYLPLIPHGQSARPMMAELEALQKDGSGVWIEVKLSVLTDSNGKPSGILGVSRDISKRIAMIDELIKAKEKAEESDRLKSAFLANMSHEIRTPMNGILGFTTLLLEPNLSTEEKNNYIEIVHKSGQRMLNTVNSIIEISKIEAGLIGLRPSPVVVNDLLADMVAFFTPESEKKGLKLFLTNRLPNHHPAVVTDKDKLESILTNLIKNAIKYTNSGSIRVGCENYNDKIEFYVQDTGIGIPANRIEAVFNRFEQADIADSRALEGLGLGLAIAKSYVGMLGGTIWVKSDEGVGTTFFFTLPNKEAMPEIKVPEKQRSSVFHREQKINVLIAEDDEASAMYIKTILSLNDIKSIHAANGMEAVKAFKENKDISLILMDIKMPVMNGLEATRQIRQLNATIPILAQTAYAFQSEKEDILNAGCNEVISKPIRPEELLSSIYGYFPAVI